MLALITGVGRKVGIGAAIAQGLAEAGYQLALSYHPKDDESQQGLSEPQQIVNDLRGCGRALCCQHAQHSITL